MQASSHQSLQSHQSSSHSVYSPRTSGGNSTGAENTPNTSSSSLFAASSLNPTPVNPLSINGGPLEASNNVINIRGDKNNSLWQYCGHLRRRLEEVPGYDKILAQEEEEADDETIQTDPVTLVWRTFRRGYPLMLIYNTIEPEVELFVNNDKVGEKKRAQAATMAFLKACIDHLNIPSEDCFIIADLYGDDTSGFVKVAKVVNRVLDILVEKGKIKAVEKKIQDNTSSIGDSKEAKFRKNVIKELIDTEVTYVQHLELLFAFKTAVEEKGAIPRDTIHQIFLNLNQLLDFQRRFLIRLEQVNDLPDEQQDWGHVFMTYKDAFMVYEQFIANQKKCEEVAMREYDKLKAAMSSSPELRQMVESTTTLTSFLLKPFQRLSKYPLLLRQLLEHGGLNENLKAHIAKGLEAPESVLQSTNAMIDREERNEAVIELRERVEDWKGHKIEGFGDLLLFGTFTVLKGEAVTSKNEEREYKIYLFEMILLCCKEINPNKQKAKIVRDKRGKPKLQLKGRIFMQNVTEAIQISKVGSYTCQIFWKGDPGIENFIIRFTTEDAMRKWATQIDTQRRQWKDNSRNSARTQQSSTSQTEFTYMINQGALENPYRQDDEEEEELTGTTYAPVDLNITRTGSSTSLRSRSATGDSGPPMNSTDPRAAPPRFPMISGPLSLQTQRMPGAPSPGERPGDSYFSPVVETPLSSRTSSSSTSTFPFPRQQTPMNGWHHEEHNRFTAPAMGRTTSRESSSIRNPQRPSLPPGSSYATSMSSQARLRSASSPDIQNSAGQRRPSNGAIQPPVPEVPPIPFPTHHAYHHGLVNRSLNNSPNFAHQLPARSATQSPSVQRERVVPAHNPFEHGPMPPRSTPFARTGTPGSLMDPPRNLTPASMETRTLSPPLAGSTLDSEGPSQLKVKVVFKTVGQSMTLVVPMNISYSTLRGRIDMKVSRVTDNQWSLLDGTLKLKYKDDDGDLVTIQSDEDVQTAFENWKEQQRDQISGGSLGEITLQLSQ
ncbi:hypothetical protein M501DRAFT_1022208 [Patellaria atrata CBS 101060]|uniref:DH domain-containing protein n=1 Tax=Patellaria atrata CBS 101060 TaxID=1346257 RepID=A0A9P4SGH4_9PEZI|nr:hypothetical protein M501DRAFT_1022208 [Patellaria atrata CBS 101060]